MTNDTNDQNGNGTIPENQMVKPKKQRAKKLTSSTILEMTMKSSHNSTKIKR